VVGGVVYMQAKGTSAPVLAAFTSGVKQLALVNGVVWQYNGALWWSWTGTNWTPAAGTSVSPISSSSSSSSSSSGGSSSGGGPAGVKVSGNKIVSTVTGAQVNLIGAPISVQSAVCNGCREAGMATLTSSNWTSIVSAVYNTLPSVAKPYGLINVIRITMNSQMYMGTACVLPYPSTDAGSYTSVGGGLYQTARSGTQIQADMAAEVAAIRGAGLYVLLDMHSGTGVNNATGQPYCGVGQDGMPTTYDVAFWTQVASTYKGDPGVMFELFNEPFYDGNGSTGNGANAAGRTALGGAGTYTLQNTSGTPKPAGCVMYDNVGGLNNTSAIAGGGVTCKGTGEQALINAIRATGATNIIWAGTANYTQDVAAFPMGLTDPQHQLGMTFHAYSSGGGIAAFNAVAAAGYPILMTEGGDIHNIGIANAYVTFRNNGWGYIWWAGSANGKWNNWGGATAAAPLVTAMQGDPPWTNNGSVAPTGTN
jgi:endoglucanase